VFRSLSPRKRLLVDLLSLVALAALALWGLWSWVGKGMSRDLAMEQTGRAAQEARQAVLAFFRPLDRALHTAAAWGAEGDLTPDPEALARRFIPLLERLPQVSGLTLADDRGREAFLAREADGTWTLRRRSAEGRFTWMRWEHGRTGPGQGPAHLDYDPRRRPWFEIAAGTEPRWTPPYLFFTRNAPGTTGAVSWQRQGHRWVLGIDLLLSDLLQAIARIPVGGRGLAFLHEGGGRLLMPTEGGRLEVALDPGRLGSGAILAGLAAWRQADRPAREPLRFAGPGGHWWLMSEPLGNGRYPLWLAVAAPEEDLVGLTQHRRGQLLGWGLLILGLMLAAAWALARRYGHQLRPVQALSDDPERREERLDALLRRGEGPELEFKSTVRFNLRSGRPDKAIELAWLKGVVGLLNTRGGLLLIGVNDDGEVLGLEADAFANADRCLLHVKNLLGKHIGGGFARYIETLVTPLHGREILVIECRRSPEPAFLLVGNDEDFYIRNGPASVKLTPRQMLQYLEHA